MSNGNGKSRLRTNVRAGGGSISIHSTSNTIINAAQNACMAVGGTFDTSSSPARAGATVTCYF